MDMHRLIAIALSIAQPLIPLVIVLLVPAKANVNEARIRLLLRLLVVATFPAMGITLAAAIYLPNVAPMAGWIFMPLWFGLGMPLIMAKRPPPRLDACPKCNYPFAGMDLTGILRCPECGRTSRPNHFLPYRMVIADDSKQSLMGRCRTLR